MGKQQTNNSPIRSLVIFTLFIFGGLFIVVLVLAVQNMSPPDDDKNITETAVTQAAAAPGLLPTAMILPTIPDTQTPTTTPSPTTTPTITATPTPDMTQVAYSQATAESQLLNVFDTLSSVHSVSYIYADPVQDKLMVSCRVMVTEGFNTVMMAQAMHQAVLNRLSGDDVEFRVRIDDGRSESDYLWDKQSESWQIGTIRASIVATPESSLTLREQNLVIPSTMRQLHTMSLDIDSYGWPPTNCDEAVARGLSAREAARWAHLDADGDGLACYGD